MPMGTFGHLVGKWNEAPETLSFDMVYVPLPLLQRYIPIFVCPPDCLPDPHKGSDSNFVVLMCSPECQTHLRAALEHGTDIRLN